MSNYLKIKLCKLAGVTLLEMLVYLTVFGLIITTIVGFALTINNSQNRENKNTAKSNDAMFVLQHVSSKIAKTVSFDEANSVFNNDNGKVRLNMNSGVGEYRITSGQLVYYDGVDSTPITQPTNSVTKWRIEPRFYQQTQLIAVEVYLTIGGKEFQTTLSIK